MTDPGRRPLRRLVPAILLVAFIAWILYLVVLIAVDPDPGSGNPMD